MKKHQLYMENPIFPLTSVIIVFALQLCIKSLHYHTVAHYSSSHVSCAVRKARILPSAFLLSLLRFPLFSFMCLLTPSLYPILYFLLPILLVLYSHHASPQSLDTYPLPPVCHLIPLRNIWDAAALVSESWLHPRCMKRSWC